MSRQVRLVIIAAVIVALLAGATFILTPPAADDGSSLKFKDLPPTDVRTVSIQNANGSISITPQDQGWVVDDIPADLVDKEKFVAMMTNCGAINALQVVDASPKDPGLYGLKEPSAAVDIAYVDNSKLSLQLGNQEKVSGNYYGRISGKDAVYLFKADTVNAFLLPKKGFVDSRVTPPLQMSSPLSAIGDITFTGGPLSAPVTLKAVTSKDEELARKAISFGAPTHLLMLNGTYELDQTYGADLFNSLLGITATDIMGYLYTPQQISDFGFSKPDMTVEFDLKGAADGTPVHYSLAVLKKDGKVYMTCNNNGVIYEVPEPKFMGIDYEKLPVRWFLKPLIIDVSKVELTVAGQTLAFEITGDKNENKKVTVGGKDLNMDRFRTFYQLLTSAAGDGTLIDGKIKAQGTPLMTLKYYYLDGKKQPDTVNIYKGDTLRDYVEVNGVVEFAMRETYLKRVQDAADILFTDKPFETQW